MILPNERRCQSLEFSLYFRFTLSRSSGGIPVSDWSKQTAKYFLEKEKAEKKRDEEKKQAILIQDRKILLDQSILERRAPEMWDDLCRRFESSCADFNSDVGRKILIFRKVDGNQIEIAKESTPEIKSRLLFDPKAYTIKFRDLGVGVGTIQHLDIKISPGTSEPRFFNMSGLDIDPVKIVEESLNSLIL